MTPKQAFPFNGPQCCRIRDFSDSSFMVISMKQNLVTLPTERLLLRPLHSSDLESVHLYASDPENTAYMSYFPKTKAETARFLENITREWENPPRISSSSPSCWRGH